MAVIERGTPEVFAQIVSEEEWQSVPLEVGEKLCRFVNEKFQEFITTKALLETNRFNAEQSYEQLKTDHDKLTSEFESIKVKLDAATNTINELESHLSTTTAELTKLRTQCNALEAETAEYRHERNLAVDDRDNHIKLIQRRDAQIERMQIDINSLSKQLEAAVNAKCEALAQVDEVASMKVNLEYHKKQIERERALMNEQIETLSEELRKRTEELLNMRRDNTSRCIQLEIRLNERTQDLAVANDQVKSLTEINNDLKTKYEELMQKMASQKDLEAKMTESYMYEIDSQTKMANAYKAMFEESQAHANELKEALAQVQNLLKTATEKYGELETKHKQSELTHEEILSRKNACIELLKKELATANELLESSKDHHLQRQLEGISPTAASASRLLKSGMTITELYSQYVSVCEKLANMEEEYAKLNNYMTSIVREIEEKGPLIQKLRVEYTNISEANDDLKEANDKLFNEVQQLRETNDEFKRMDGVQKRECDRLRKEVNDLGRQVCHLLNEVEKSRVGAFNTGGEMDYTDSVCSADIISKRLVTFNDISELQANNQKLLALVRELSERQEEAESLDPAAIAQLKAKLESVRSEHQDLLVERERQNKMMTTLQNQRDMYKNLYSQAVKAHGEEISTQLSQSGENEKQNEEPGTPSTNNKMQELEKQVEEYKKKVQSMKEDSDSYRKEKAHNEKMLLDQMDQMRAEIKELTKHNCKLLSQCDMNDERMKILQNNIEIYKKQIMALEKQNKIYSESIVKHEQAATYLKDETIRCQTKMSEFEVMVANLQKENALLRDKEQMLLRDRDILRRDSHQQNLIQSNIELIKATLDRADAEGKLRLESRLDEAFRECAALRRRLQEEQDTFRSLSEHLKKQTENAQSRMEEERSQADKLRKEVAELREELILKSNQIEDLTKKLKTSILNIPESNVAGRRIRELENQLLDAQAETQSVRNILKTIKEASENYCNVAAASETQLKEFMEKEQKLQEEIESQKATIQQLQEKCRELEGELSVQMDDQDIANASIKSKSSQLEEELNTATMDLQTARDQLTAARSEIRSLTEQLKVSESKYAREMMLHSVDLQALTQMKEELDKVMGEVNELKSARDQAVTALNESRESWANQEKIFEKEKLDMEQRFKDMDAQNSLLLDQIQAINTNLSILQSQASGSGDGNQSMGDTSFNRSLNEDEVKSSDQLLKIIKYLRQEKDIAVNKADIMDAELTRLKSQFDLLTKEYEETKRALQVEQQRSEISVVSAAKHAEVLRKLETLNAITDSNRALRQERDQLIQQVHDLKARTETLEAEMAPLQEKNRDLATKADQMQNENISLRAEATRWRQRANMLIEKTNRTSPEDWKRLQTERENLAKQLTVERATTTKLNEEIASLRSEKSKMEEQMKALRAQNNTLSEEVSQLRESINSLQNQVNDISQNLEQTQESNKRVTEENRVLNEDSAGKDVQINELRNNLGQIRKIAKKYKTQSEDYLKEIETLKQQVAQMESKESEQGTSGDKQESAEKTQEQANQENAVHRETVENLNRIISTSQEQIDSLKGEIEALKRSGEEKEDKFKTLFKNAKERIVSLTEQNTHLKKELNKQSGSIESPNAGPSTQSDNSELLEKIEKLQRENQEISEEKLQEKEKLTAEIDNLTQRVLQLQRQLGSQQGSKPSTSSGSSEKSTSEPPTANIKPMAGHSTNTQTQSVSIQPWRSGGEPPLASIRPMSAQLRTVAVLPTSQSPSAVMVPPQQQVHTTGSSSIEALSSSPTSSHTDYVPATSSASPAMLGPRQVAVPPTQSSQDAEDDENNVQMQSAPQQQAVALVSPRVEPPSSGVGPTQEQGTSSSSNTVTTTQAGLKRQRDSDSDTCQGDQDKQQQTKRTRVLQQASGSGLEVEYQVPTSSQRDHDDDNVIVVESDEEGGADEGEGADDDQEDPDTEGYDMEGMMEQDNYEDADCQDVEDEEEGGNEVEVIEDSSEVPNQSERSIQESPEEEEGGEQQAQSEAISSGTIDGSSSGGVTLSQASTSVSMTMPSFSRTRPVAPLPSSRVQQHHSSSLHLASHISSGLEECGDDGIVPSTPTLFVPRRSDGFGEAVSSPHVPTSVGRFTFGESSNLHASSAAGSTEVLPEQTLEVSPQMDDNSTGRSVPTTPLQSSPQESVGDEQTASHQTTQSDAEIPIITVSAVGDIMPENVAGGSSSMGPPSTAGPSSEGSQQPEQAEQMLEGEDEVSSEGEKPVTMEEGGEEEGREAEASPSTATRRNLRHVEARRSLRQTMSRGSVPKSSPTPIVWGDPRTQHQQQQQQQQLPQQQQMQHPQQQRNMQDRGRGGFRGTARRSRQRHGYGRF